MLNDIFAWLPYEQALLQRKRILPDEMTRWNKAVADTNNFFAIVGSGAFTPGLLLILPKAFMHSFAELQDDQIQEMEWFLSRMSWVIESTYAVSTILAEHGTSPSQGVDGKSYDHAHLHIFPISKKVSEQRLTDAINFTLEQRAAGITGSLYCNRTNTSNGCASLASYGEASDKREGQLYIQPLTLKDLKKYSMDDIVHSVRIPMQDNGYYTYFKTPWESNSFLMNYDLQSQFVRQIIYNAEMGIVSRTTDNGKADWRWQENPHWENMFAAMKDIAPYMQCVEKDALAKNFGFQNDVLIKPGS